MSDPSRLPAEIWLQIFSLQEDITQAEWLSATSKYLREVYIQNETYILKAIISTSPVYETELLLSKLLTANKKLSEVLIQKGHASTRPGYDELMTCFSDVDMDIRKISDETARDIRNRYHQAVCLSNLFSERKGEFEEFQSLKESQYREHAMLFVQPGFTVPRRASAAKVAETEEKAGPPPQQLSSFRTSFCKAISTVALAVAASFQGNCSYIPDTKLCDDAAVPVDKLRRFRYHGFLSGVPALTGLGAAQTIDAWDFCYSFVLPKLIPRARLNMWFPERARQSLPSYPVHSANDPTVWYSRGQIAPWTWFLGVCAQRLTPYHLVGLLRGPDSHLDEYFPADIRAYQTAHGIRDSLPIGANWMNQYPREQMLGFYRGRLNPNLQNGELAWGVYSSVRWWDGTRGHLGSPFDQIDACDSDLPLEERYGPTTVTPPISP